MSKPDANLLHVAISTSTSLPPPGSSSRRWLGEPTLASPVFTFLPPRGRELISTGKKLLQSSDLPPRSGTHTLSAPSSPGSKPAICSQTPGNLDTSLALVFWGPGAQARWGGTAKSVALCLVVFFCVTFPGRGASASGLKGGKAKGEGMRKDWQFVGALGGGSRERIGGVTVYQHPKIAPCRELPAVPSLSLPQSTPLSLEELILTLAGLAGRRLETAYLSLHGPHPIPPPGLLTGPQTCSQGSIKMNPWSGWPGQRSEPHSASERPYPTRTTVNGPGGGALELSSLVPLLLCFIPGHPTLLPHFQGDRKELYLNHQGICHGEVFKVKQPATSGPLHSLSSAYITFLPLEMCVLFLLKCHLIEEAISL